VCAGPAPKATFESLDEYYGTLFHELTHWSEHESRLNWSRKEKDNTYAFGELVAEIGSCYICRELGVPASDDLSNHLAYVKNWLQAMKNDSRFIFAASGQASKAADYLLSFSRKPEDVPVPDGELAAV
jgi:antirestriction protein ArdC